MKESKSDARGREKKFQLKFYGLEIGGREILNIKVLKNRKNINCEIVYSGCR